MADGEGIRDEAVWQSPADREALREALLDGSLSPAEFVERWPGSSRQAALIRSTFELFDEWGYDTGTASRTGNAVDAAGDVSACDAAIDRAREAVDSLDGSPAREEPDHARHWRADDATRTSEVRLDLDGDVW